jgi:8-oxo-dGTP pyrophosphatase MutT (NUDIX family)
MIPAYSRPDFINSLQSKLLFQELPGPSAQEKMAHAIRRAGPLPEKATMKEAAVLMILFEKNPSDFYLIFIHRVSSQAADKHAGQIAFPGGKKEKADPDLMYTALREAEEEIAIDLAQIDVLGPLTPLYIPVSKYQVHPFVAYSRKEPVLSKQDSEIENIIEFPLASFVDPSSRRMTRIEISPGIVLNHVPTYTINGFEIWGATAMIMSEFLEVLHVA